MEPSRDIDNKILEFVRKGYVQVLDSGVVLSSATNKPMGTVRKNGYIQVCMKRDGVRFLCYAHRIVALVKHGRPKAQTMQVNHIDGNKGNNKPSNLEWVSAKENLAHARKVGLTYDYGENNGHAKITDKQAEFIRRSKLPKATLASKYGVAVGTINSIKSGRSRKAPTVAKLEKCKSNIPEVKLLRVLDSMLPAEDASKKFSISIAKVEAIRTKAKYRKIAERNGFTVHPTWVYSYVRKGVQSEAARHIMTSLKPIPKLAKDHKIPEQVARDIYNGITHKKLRKYLGIARKCVQATTRLTDANIKRILKSSSTQEEIARTYGVSRTAVSNIQNGKSFKHLTSKGRK